MESLRNLITGGQPTATPSRQADHIGDQTPAVPSHLAAILMASPERRKVV